MGIIILAMVLMIVGIIIGKINIFKSFEESELVLRKGWNPLFALLLPILALSFGCTATVGANEAGVQFDTFGGLKNEVLSEGLHFKSPLISVKKVSTKLNTSQFELTSQTGGGSAGGQFVTYQVTINYNIDKTEATNFYKLHGRLDVVETMLKGQVQSAVQGASEKVTVYEIMGGKRGQVEAEAKQNMITSLAKLYINVNDFQIRDVDAGAEIEKIIKDKAAAEAAVAIAAAKAEADLKAEQGRIAVEAAKVAHELEMKKLQANNEKELAEIEAEILRVQAEAQAEAQRIKEEMRAKLALEMAYGYGFAVKDENGNITITEEKASEYAKLIAYLAWCEAWDGELPETVVGSDGTISIIIPGWN